MNNKNHIWLKLTPTVICTLTEKALENAQTDLHAYSCKMHCKLLRQNAATTYFDAYIAPVIEL